MNKYKEIKKENEMKGRIRRGKQMEMRRV